MSNTFFFQKKHEHQNMNLYITLNGSIIRLSILYNMCFFVHFFKVSKMKYLNNLLNN